MTEPRRRGRPAKTEACRRSVAVMVRLSPEEAKNVREFAQLTGLTVAAYLRELGLRHQVRAVLPALDLQLVSELNRLGRNFNQALVLAYTGRAPSDLVPLVESLLDLLVRVRDGVLLRQRGGAEP